MSAERGLTALDSPPESLGGWLRNSVFEPVLSVMFPPRCVGCGDFEHHLCPRCEASLTAIGPDCCPRCGEPGPRPLVGRRCSHCMGLELAYTGARSAFVHAGVAKRMVVEFKSGGQPVLAPLMARLAASAFAELVAQATARPGVGSPGGASAPGASGSSGGVLVTWVPTHPAARRERGYNQAELLARALAAGHVPALPTAGSTRKVARTRHQKALDRADRQANLRGAFVLDGQMSGTAGVGTGSGAEALRPPQAARGPQALIVVDDVYTTGATTQEVARTLVTGTGGPVYVFTFSRAISARTEGHD